MRKRLLAKKRDPSRMLVVGRKLKFVDQKEVSSTF